MLRKIWRPEHDIFEEPAVLESMKLTYPHLCSTGRSLPQEKVPFSIRMATSVK